MPFHYQCHHGVVSRTWASSPFFAFYLTDVGRNCILGRIVDVDNCRIHIFLCDGPNIVIPTPHVCILLLWNRKHLGLFFFNLSCMFVINCPSQCCTCLCL